ncbi:hypothetical protein LSUE1_G007554 [Lachnellula suecica]|uniref:Uncharacterized protein n=1 Tax=Lachnellula suecica TaxID=602035 RepID=A0A8T9C5F6_9HELO|nr:hypothetical protein LSUE1_G007554 [Lachnellula suecica]
MPPLRTFFRPSTLPKLIPLLPRTYSTSTPLIKVLDVQAPGSGRIRILSLARPSARNAISRALLQELRSNIDAVASQYDAEGNELPAPKRFGGAAGEDEREAVRAVVLASEDFSIPSESEEHFFSPL